VSTTRFHDTTGPSELCQLLGSFDETCLTARAIMHRTV